MCISFILSTPSILLPLQTQSNKTVPDFKQGCEKAASDDFGISSWKKPICFWLPLILHEI
jgi:hypothetical protein